MIRPLFAYLAGAGTITGVVLATGGNSLAMFTLGVLATVAAVLLVCRAVGTARLGRFLIRLSTEPPPAQTVYKARQGQAPRPAAGHRMPSKAARLREFRVFLSDRSTAELKKGLDSHIQSLPEGERAAAQDALIEELDSRAGINDDDELFGERAA